MRLGIDHNNCSFCEQDIETTAHPFFLFLFYCTQQFSGKIFKTTKIVLSVPLTKKDVVFGLILKDNICDLIFNNLIFNNNFITIL